MTRAALLAALGAAACSPQIASGSYYCGPQGLCPSDQVCNPADGTCVLDGEDEPFACPAHESEPDNTPAQAVVVSGVNCVDMAVSLDDCIDPGDTADWRTISIPASCTNPVSLAIKVSFDAAFQPLQAALTDASGTPIASSQPCAAAGAGNITGACIATSGSAGASYDLVVEPVGSDCGGNCNFNTYTLSIVGGAP